MFSLSVVIFSVRYKSEFLLFNKIAWNLSGLTIILLSLNQFMTQPLSNSKMLARLFKVLAKLTKYYHQRNYEQTHQEKEKIAEQNIK